MSYKYEDDIGVAENEFDEYTYGWVVMDANGEVVALTASEVHAEKITNALNAALNLHEKD